VHIDSFLVGDMTFGTSRLPIVTDALGVPMEFLAPTACRAGASWSTSAMTNHYPALAQRACRTCFRTIPFELVRGNLLQVDASVGGIRIKAIIDTGGQVTIATWLCDRRWSSGDYRCTELPTRSPALPPTCSKAMPLRHRHF